MCWQTREVLFHYLCCYHCCKYTWYEGCNKDNRWYFGKKKKKDYLLHRNRTCVLTKDMIFRGIEHESIKRYYISHIRQRGEDNSLIMNNDGFHVCRRWVVERTNSWHNRFRKLLVRYEKIAENYLGLVQLACCIIVSRKIILG